MSYGESFTEEEFHARFEQRMTTAGLIPKPNAWCYFCGYPLGIRSPRGPRGEISDPFIYVRTHAHAVSPGNDLGDWQSMRHLWELPDGTTQMATLFERMNAVLETLERQLDDLEREDGEEPGGWRRRELRQGLLRELHSDRTAPSAASVERVMARAPKWEAYGVVRLLPWRKTTRVNYTVDGRRYRVYKLGEPFSIIPLPAHYELADGTTRIREVIVPRDVAPLIRGIYVRCPNAKCRKIRPLE